MRSAVSGNVLPLRFGTIFADQHALELACAELRPGLADTFARLRGRDEYRLSARRPEQAAPRPSSGADYLRQRKQALTEVDGAGDRLLHLATEHVDDVRLAAGRPEEAVVDVLARPEELTQLVAALSADGYGVAVDGPLPPYHFVSIDAAAGAS